MVVTESAGPRLLRRFFALNPVAKAWILFLLAVPGALGLMWTISRFFGQAGQDHAPVRIAALVLVACSALGTLAGFFYAVRGAWQYRSPNLGRLPAVALLALVANGLSLLLWLSLFLIMYLGPNGG